MNTNQKITAVVVSGFVTSFFVISMLSTYIQKQAKTIKDYEDLITRCQRLNADSLAAKSLIKLDSIIVDYYKSKRKHLRPMALRSGRIFNYKSSIE